MPDSTNRRRELAPASGKGGLKKSSKIIGKVFFKIFSYVLNVLLTLLLIGLVCGIIIGTAFTLYVKNYVDTNIDMSILSTSESDSTTRIYYMDYTDRENRVGTPVEVEDQRIYSTDNSIWVPYSEIPDMLVDTLVSIEDKRFYSHNGVDWIRTVAAVPNYFLGDGQFFGGSTITQQLIKNITGDNEVKIQRKVQEIFRALNLENQLSKEQILEMYLNVVYFGNHCYGVQAAAQFYFDKDLSELTLSECASIVGIVQNPSKNDPLYHLEKNLKRRDDIINEMLVQGKISEIEANEAWNEELHVVTDSDSSGESNQNTVFSWYTESLFTEVKNDLMEKYGYSDYVASMSIYTGGLKIYTPMDPFVQETLEQIYEENSSDVFLSTSETLQPESAMVVMDPYTGDVLGLVGGRGEKTLNRILNRATGTKRPPGSSIKPLSIYAPAMEMGLINYSSILYDEPIQLDTGDYWPHNLPDTYEGNVTLAYAIKTSKNTTAVRLLQELTPRTSFNFLHEQLNIYSLVESKETEDGRIISDVDLAPLALGQFSYGVTVKEITAGYTIFPNLGIYSKPRLYLSVTDSEGVNLLTCEAEQEVVISETTACIMTELLKGVTEPEAGGTASHMKIATLMDTAGKTGTSTADFDRWFVGYTPYYLAGVWVGYDNNIALSSFASNPAASIWDNVMLKLHEEVLNNAASGTEKLKEFTISPGVIEVNICSHSGMVATSFCPESSVTYYTSGTEPTAKCTYHTTPIEETQEADSKDKS